MQLGMPNDLLAASPPEMPSVMTAEQLSPIVHISVAALAQDRYRGRGIPFVKVGTKRVRYLREDVLKYLQDNRMRRTDDPRPGVA